MNFLKFWPLTQVKHMKVNFEFEDSIGGITKELADMELTLEKEENSTLKEMGKVVMKNVVKHMKRSNVEAEAVKIPPKNYDGSTPYKHMKDDVKVAVKTAKAGHKYVVIQGGRLTGYKWKFINDGTTKNGRIHTRATHFVDSAMEDSNCDIARIINELSRKVVRNDG